MKFLAVILSLSLPVAVLSFVHTTKPADQDDRRQLSEQQQQQDATPAEALPKAASNPVVRGMSSNSNKRVLKVGPPPTPPPYPGKGGKGKGGGYDDYYIKGDDYYYDDYYTKGGKGKGGGYDDYYIKGDDYYYDDYYTKGGKGKGGGYDDYYVKGGDDYYYDDYYYDDYYVKGGKGKGGVPAPTPGKGKGGVPAPTPGKGGGGTPAPAPTVGKGKGAPTDCPSFPIYFFKSEIIAAEYTNAIGFGLNVVPFYDADTGAQLGTYSDFATEIPNSDECLVDGAFSFDPAPDSELFRSTVNVAFTCGSESNAVIGGTGRFGCAGGYEVFQFEDEEILGTALFLCDDLCPFRFKDEERRRK